MTTLKDDSATGAVIQRRGIDVSYKGLWHHFEVEVIDSKGHELASGAATDFVRMRDAAALDGVELYVNTALRDQDHQRRLRDAWERYDGYLAATRLWADHGKQGDPPKVVPFSAHAAKPGRSTHEIGCSVDLQRADGDDPTTPEPDSPTDLWLRAHAHEYGFIRDVPSEPWHWTHRSAWA